MQSKENVEEEKRKLQIQFEKAEAEKRVLNDKLTNVRKEVNSELQKVSELFNFLLLIYLYQKNVIIYNILCV